MNSALPAVERDDASAEFFDAAARGELLVKRSTVSGTVLGPEVRTDPVSGSPDLEPYVVSGAGTLVSWTVVHRAPTPVLAAAVPYVSAIVELVEGPWLTVRLIADDPARLRAGIPVRARFLPTGDPADGSGEGEVAAVFESVLD
ncbi:acyl dehydratase [Mycobacterium avium 09-5983]|nr:acyl dehydratase [Mycobacterium avium 09-5983]ETB33340.1 acyl dehydratase [Mycobacterium avium subsp. hominissuis 10-5606]